jgi:hypothetical protein
MLNGQTKKQDSTASEEEGEGLFAVNTEIFKDRGLHHQVDLGYVQKVFRGPT